MSEPRTDAKICGMGHSMKRKEDPRFIRGQGRYIDDHVLPGMLYMDIVRSPHAHARIKKIDTSKATGGRIRFRQTSSLARDSIARARKSFGNSGAKNQVLYLSANTFHVMPAVRFPWARTAGAR